MSYRFGLWSKLASASVLAALIFCWPAAAQEKRNPKGQEPAQDGQASLEERKKEEGDVARKRAEWFYNQRAYPLGSIPANARTAALQQLDRMLELEGRLVRQADGSLALAPAAASVTTNIWTPIGPQPTVGTFFGNTSGRVNAIAVDPTNPNNVFLGGAQGGIWRSTDGGINWTPLTDSQASLAIGSIAIDPSNPNIVYVGTGEENFAFDSYYGVGILKSTNALDPNPANVTWTQLGQSVFLGTGGGPISSASGGARIGSLAINPTNSQILLAGVQTISSSSTSGIYCSNDGGLNWTQVISGAPGTDVVFDPGGTIAYAAVGRIIGNAANGVYRSANAGAACASQTWATRIGTAPNVLPTGTAAGRISLALAPSSPSTIYASIQDPVSVASLVGMFKTTDGGANWTKLTNTPDFCNPQCWYDMVVRVKPDDPLTIFAGGSATGNGTLIRSTDGGTSWLNVSNGVGGVRLHVDHHALAFSKPGTGTLKLYVGNDGGAWSTTDITAPNSSINWANLNNTLNITQFYPAHSIHPSDEKIGFGGTQDNGSQNYTGSLGWVDNNACGDGGWTAIDPAVPSTVYVTCQNVDIEKSTQNGDVNTFNFAAIGISQNDNGSFIPPFVIDPSTPQRLYFGTVRLWQTSDGAGTWSSISGDLTGGGSLSTIAVAPSDSKTIYVGSSSGHVQVSTNVVAGSAIFNDISNGLPARAVTQIVVDPADPKTAYVTFSGFKIGADIQGHIFKTTNGLSPWMDISGNLPNTPVNDLVIDPDDAARKTLYAATDIGVFQTTDGGVIWSAMNPATQGASGLPRVAVLSLRLHEPSRTLRAATHGRGVWDLTLPNLAGTPTFSLSSIRPSSRAFGTASFQLTVNGNGFTVNSVVMWNGSTAGVTSRTFVSANQLTATIDASLLVTAATAKVTVTDPGQASPTNSLVFTVTGTPTISTVVPSTVPLGSPSTTVTINGTGFASGAQVNFNGSATGVTTNPGGTSAQLTALLSSALLGGAFGGGNDITVVNPAPGGGTSLPALFTVAASAPPNNNFALATVVNSGSFSNTVDNSGATTEATDPTPNCAPQSASPPIKTVWYKFTAGGSGTVTADTVGSSYDTILTVFTSASGSFTQVACNDDINPGIVIESRLTFPVTSGTPYFLMVSAFGLADPNTLGQGGKTVFNLTTSVPVGGVSDFSVTSPTGPQTVNAGQSANYTMTVSAVNGAFNSAVLLSCTGVLPAQANCSFNPASVTPGGTSANSTLTISTTARSSVPPVAFRRPRARPFLLPWPAVVLLALAAAALALRARQRRWAAAVPLILLFVLLAIQAVGCGGNPSSGGPPPVNGTPAGTYTITVTGTSGATQHSMTVTLTVN